MAEVDDFLAHYGVRGMRWGKRKGSNDKQVAVPPRAAGYTDRMQKNDFRRVGKDKGIEKVHQKVADGTSLNKARQQVMEERYNKKARIAGQLTIAAVGLAYAAPMLKEFGGIVIDQAVIAKKQSNGRKHAANLFADKNGIANYETIRLQQNPTTGNWV